MSEALPATHYTVGDLAKAASVDPGTVRRWATELRLPCTRTVGGVRLFRREDVERFLKERQG